MSETQNPDEPQSASERTDYRARVTVERRDFDQFVDAISALVGEARVRLEDSAMTSAAVDAANISRVEAEAEYGPFGSGPYEQVERSPSEGKLFGVHMDELAEAIDNVDGMDGYRLSFFEDELVVEGYNDEESVTLIDPQRIREPSAHPDAEYGVEIEPAAYQFKGVVGTIAEGVCLGTSGSNMTFTATDAGLRVRGKDEKHADDYAYDWTVPAEVEGLGRANFSADYVWDIIAAIPADQDLTVRMGSDEPLEISVGDWATFHVARRIVHSNDDEEGESDE